MAQTDTRPVVIVLDRVSRLMRFTSEDSKIQLEAIQGMARGSKPLGVETGAGEEFVDKAQVVQRWYKVDDFSKWQPFVDKELPCEPDPAHGQYPYTCVAY